MWQDSLMMEALGIHLNAQHWCQQWGHQQRRWIWLNFCAMQYDAVWVNDGYQICASLHPGSITLYCENCLLKALFNCVTFARIATCLRCVSPVLRQTCLPDLSLTLTMCPQHKQSVTPSPFIWENWAPEASQVILITAATARLVLEGSSF